MSHLSITGLRLRSAWHAPRFWWLAMRSMAAARRADGCLEAHARSIDGVHHTVSLWRDAAAMRAYLASGAHREAMQAYRRMAEGKVLGRDAERVPDWSEVHRLWRDLGRPV